ncbi:Aldo/keto reductase [Dichomitus squalens]|uniref:Aldo/keto reductase n=1 Tax=Dichomitus squalens TaxID=114155 RepID=A0A4V6MWK0_9APHY|nr:Aldo/keto reductase [Dichomitus squalens]TBU50503.1 Aldo/keto reductase [Dichomitus squalens]TBU61309.1 Aldo/keto reductase [Dichomitus squalens]
MVVPLGSPQPVFALPLLEDIPDDLADRPVDGPPFKDIGPLGLPQIIFGAATFSGSYNSEATIASDVPVRTVRLALRYGIRAFDTSPYYGPSEIVLGTALKVLEPILPRSSYKLMTKCGRYGLTQSEFDYSPETIRKSVERSLKRLHTTYLDTVYLHDVEFVCTPVGPLEAGNPESALFEKSAEYGLAAGQEGKVWGEGDQKILDAYAELRRLQEEGKIKHIGITGYTLSTLLRLALLVLHTPPYRPLDALLSYCHLSLNNSTFATYAKPLRERAKVTQLVTASPLSMGLLTPTPPPWHPAPAELKEAAKDANRLVEDAGWEGGLPNLAIGYGFRKGQETDLPVVVGLSSPREVHESVRAWRTIQKGTDEGQRVVLEDKVIRTFGSSLNLSWASPPEELRV